MKKTDTIIRMGLTNIRLAFTFLVIIYFLILSVTKIEAQTTITISDAGLTAVNGEYSLSGSGGFFGRDSYHKPNWDILWDGVNNRWIITTALSFTNYAYYNNSNTVSLPLIGWQVGPSGAAPAPTLLTSPLSSTNVNLKVFLQGPFKNGLMTTYLNSNGVIPLNSENAYHAASFGYTAKSVLSIPNANVVDWVIVELRSGTTPATKLSAQAGFILKNGIIVDKDGSSQLNFPGVNVGSYFVVVFQRNHLSIMSSLPVDINATSNLYDFTTSQTQAFGNNGMVDLTGGGTVFGMIAGDANQDGQITSSDYNVFSPKFYAATYGYEISDLNMDGQVTSSDFNIFNVNYYLVKRTNVR